MEPSCSWRPTHAAARQRTPGARDLCPGLALVAPAATASCSPNAAAIGSPEREARRQAALARLTALLQAQPDGQFEVLNNRGYAYPSMRDPRQELLIVEMEARRQRLMHSQSS